MDRTLNKKNIDSIIQNYTKSIEEVGNTLLGLKGVELLQCVKRDQLGSGPYPHVSLFEAANRIMTDLVILKGVKWLLDSQKFPFDEYVVEYGNEANNDHDITARQNGKSLCGEAFNVAPSFFQAKKCSALRKLRGSKTTLDYKLIIANSDAVYDTYIPKLQLSEYYLFINIESGIGRLCQV